MPKKIIIGFQTDKEYKERVIEAGKNFKMGGVAQPINLSMFCRMAVSRLLNELETKGEI